eukprot:TRINITY_DN9511_c0_g2_i1.p1 TRINITY_DN9511_c0_g2~~TRINITY_DN9511_c0_g2_i1.p1  ORF type:complete len:449 (+),score=112.52 TRINITY_DN9511_c0_g2_i1:184-1530(+)
MQKCTFYTHLFSRYLLNQPGIPNIVREASVLEFKHRLLLLRHKKSSFPEDLKKGIKDNIDEVTLKDHEVKITYYSMDYYQVIRQVLPSDVETPQPLERLGQIVCFFLSSQQYLYRRIIAEVWLDKHPETKTVINRECNPVEMRICSEHIMGEKEGKVRVREGDKLELVLDYLNGGYTARMEDEYKDFLQSVNMNCTVCDVVADCGHIAINAVRKGCKVIANCESQTAYAQFLSNLGNNLLEKLSQVKVYNVKTDCFIRQFMSPNQESLQAKKELGAISVIYINDPFKAFDHIKEIIRTLRKSCENRTTQSSLWNASNLPRIYFYFAAVRSLSKSFFVDKLRQIFEIECGYYSFNEKHIIKMKENRCIYPSFFFHCLHIRIPAAAIFSIEYIKDFESQDLQARPTICDLNIGGILGMDTEEEARPLIGKREQLNTELENASLKRAKVDE